ncbi:hypothetical protein Taro_011145 [Colocasia esculenta]|uniref:Uncharacterized protein n=1 Tax=Colocasia esculenta TaxID=4460 RepID=A0A843U9T2_COLES|nr:hypothetical protein [Colocasia esculenta]
MPTPSLASAGTHVQVADEEEHELLLLKPSSLRFPASKHDLSNPRGRPMGREGLFKGGATLTPTGNSTKKQ